MYLLKKEKIPPPPIVKKENKFFTVEHRDRRNCGCTSRARRTSRVWSRQVRGTPPRRTGSTHAWPRYVGWRTTLACWFFRIWSKSTLFLKVSLERKSIPQTRIGNRNSWLPLGWSKNRGTCWSWHSRTGWRLCPLSALWIILYINKI